ncbi:zona pellucida sperm-binding protein 3 [Amia ocellicauda]|uniref:zona pellucida sperm-binding protein 3 n=1 Tax=Amia ocellicauda TaxID=2972642 RepID=UPI003464AB24
MEGGTNCYLSLSVVCSMIGFCHAGHWADLSLTSFRPTRKGVLQLASIPPLYRRSVTRALSAQCGRRTVEVAVHRDLFGTGRLIQASDVQMGGCTVARQEASARVLVFESALKGCGSRVTVTSESVVYSFSLVYHPAALPGFPIVRTSPFSVGIECHYPSDPLKPTWAPFTSTHSVEDLLDFSLQLMTDDWSSQRPSEVYFLGDVLNLEASVHGASRVPLRLFVDSCVATLEPDQTSLPSYTLVENKGCLVDAKVTGSHSRFLDRLQDDTLQMQLDAFKFHVGSRSKIYITCHLRVTDTFQRVSVVDKACSFLDNRWSSVDGLDQVCVCCDGGRCGRIRRSEPHYGRAGDVTVGPLAVLDPVEDHPFSLLPATRGLNKDPKGPKGSSAVIAMSVMAAALGLACVAVVGVGVQRRGRRNPSFN